MKRSPIPLYSELERLVAQHDDPEILRAFARKTNDEISTAGFTQEFVRALALAPGSIPTRRAYAETFLNAINTGIITDEDATWMLTGMLNQGSKNRSLELPPALTAHYRELLAKVVRDPWQMTPLRCAQLAATLAGKIIAVPVPSTGGEGGFNLSWRIAAINLETAFDLAGLFLFSDFFMHIHQCQLSSCGIFFLATGTSSGKKGRYRTEYCSPAHREMRLDGEGSSRVQASRAGVTAEEWREIKAQHPDMTPTKWKAQSPRKGK